MDWGGDTKPPPPWEWDGLAALDPRHTQPPLEFWAVDSGPLYSPGELGHGRSSRSSISPSTDSAGAFRRRELEDLDGIRVEDSSGGSSEAVVSVCSGSGDPPIGLKLGKRTYFEDMGLGSDPKPPPGSEPKALSGSSTGKRKGKAQSHVARCQVEGCNLDLSGAKDYHRKHKVCEGHSKSPRVVVGGRERRFCQQCSRFHDLSEFDQRKRSCRRRLSDHNARRRKPPPEMISFSSARMYPSFYDDAHQINFLWNRSPFNYPGPNTSMMWGGSSEFRTMQTRDFSVSSAKLGDAGCASRCPPSNEPSNSFATIQLGMDKLLPSKGSVTEILSEGLEEAATVASQLNGASDIRRALSLLSNESWALASTEPSSVPNQIVHTSHPDLDFPGIPSNSYNWVAEMPPIQGSRKLQVTFYPSGSQHQVLHLRKPSHESASFDVNHIDLSSE